jgi:hypothetical protein
LVIEYERPGSFIRAAKRDEAVRQVCEYLTGLTLGPEQILHRDARPPRQVRDSVSPELERICLKALRKRTGDRYPTAKDMASDLWRFLRTVARSPKYYIYLSRAKIELLYAQVPRQRRLELAENLGWKQVMGTEEPTCTPWPDERLIAKASIVEAFLDERELIGTIDRPKAYVMRPENETTKPLFLWWKRHGQAVAFSPAPRSQPR